MIELINVTNNAAENATVASRKRRGKRLGSLLPVLTHQKQKWIQWA